jgi:hypothetical protein
MAFISFNSRVVEHRTRFVCLGETPSPRVRCLLALFTYLLTYCVTTRVEGAVPLFYGVGGRPDPVVLGETDRMG